MTIKEAFDSGDKGRFLIIWDTGYAGIEIESRHKTLEDAIKALAALQPNNSIVEEYYLLCMVGRK